MVGRRRADVHLAAPDRLGQTCAHLLAMRRDARLLADQDAIRVHELPAGRLALSPPVAEQVEAAGAAEALVARREQRADVPETRRAEHSVDQRVSEHVTVGVTGQAAVELEPHAAENERHAALERVRIHSYADAVGHGSAAGSSSSEPMSTA